MFCPKCGNEIENGVKFCPGCGAKIPESPAPSAPENPAYTAPENPAYTAPENPAYTAPENPAYTAPENPAYTAPENPAYTAPENPAYTAPQAPAYTIPGGNNTFNGSAIVAPGGKKGRGTGLIIGGAVAVVAVLVLAVVLFSGLFSSPKGQLEKALGKTAGAYADAWKNLDYPDMTELARNKAYSQRIRFALSSISPELTGYYYDLSALRGLGMRMDVDYDQSGRKMDADMAVFWSDGDIMSVQMLVDNSEICFLSPDFTKNKAYGFNSETLGADLYRLGVETDEVDIRKIGFNVFDLAEQSTLEKEQLEEIAKVCVEANQQLLKAIEVEKTGKESIEVNGRTVKATAYHVVVTKDAMKDYINAMEDALKVVDSTERMQKMLEGMGFDKKTAREMISEMGDTDVYGEMADELREMVRTVGDVELEVYVSNGYISAVEYSGRVDGTKVEIGLYLGGGDNYVDDLSMEITVDGEKLTVESTGNHKGKDGVFTDETTIRGDANRVTSVLRYEPKATSDNFEWEIRVDSTASVAVEGQLTTTKDSVDFQVDELSVKAAGSRLFTLKGEYYLGPCEGMTVSASSPTMLADMDNGDLIELYYDIMGNAYAWAYTLEDRIPSSLLYYLY